VTSTEVNSLKRKAENAGNELERRGPNPFSELQPSTFNLPQLRNI